GSPTAREEALETMPPAKRVKLSEAPAPSNVASPQRACAVTGSPVGRGPEKELAPKMVSEGMTGLEEARDALKRALKEKKGHKEALAWLKGLQHRQVTARELQHTRIGLVVNEWRKEKKTSVSTLASHLLSLWKKLWLEAQKAPST
ncbi:Uncharacterized protein SCF082_LOCUS31225, partial [Durusdinium trenchii]